MTIDGLIRDLIEGQASEGLRIYVWPSKAGYQANVASKAESWTVFVHPDPVEAVRGVLTQRAGKTIQAADEDLVG